jgi:hypothetical protein
MTKKEAANLRKTIAKNPSVDADQLKESLDLIRELEQTGMINAHNFSIEDEESVCVMHIG